VQGKQTLKDEADEIQREIEELREEITSVDREIRVAEREACVKGPEEAKAIELAAKEAKEFAQALEQAR
jgi:prefoldin subunit 5